MPWNFVCGYSWNTGYDCLPINQYIMQSRSWWALEETTEERPPPVLPPYISSAPTAHCSNTSGKYATMRETDRLSINTAETCWHSRNGFRVDSIMFCLWCMEVGLFLNECGRSRDTLRLKFSGFNNPLKKRLPSWMLVVHLYTTHTLAANKLREYTKLVHPHRTPT